MTFFHRYIVTLSWVFSSLVGMACAATAQDRATAIVAVPHISQLVQMGENGEWAGPLMEVLAQVENASEVSLTKRVIPFKRAVLMTREGEADFGVFMESAKRNQMALPVKKLGDAIYVIVSLKDNQITALDQLEGKTVARIRGGTDVKSLSYLKGVNYHLFNRHEDGLRLLKSKRVDALLTLDFRVLEAIDRLELSYDEIARPLPVEGRGLWLYWSWKSKLDFEVVRKIKLGPEVTIKGMDPVVLFDAYKNRLK